MIRSVLVGVLAILAACGNDRAAEASQRQGGPPAADASAAAPAAEDQPAFAARCRTETLAGNPQAAPWVDGACAEEWTRAQAAMPMAERLLAAAAGRDAGGAALTGVEMASSGTAGAGTLSFRWSETGGFPPYDLPAALRVRGVPLQTLGCPEFPMVSAGQEKVFLVSPPGAAPFVLTVYSRAAALASEPGFYEVDAAFGGPVPGMAALTRGAYPGGGGRAFAPEAAGWTADCPDPE